MSGAWMDAKPVIIAAGVVLSWTAVRCWRDASGPRRWTRGLFWALFALRGRRVPKSRFFAFCAGAITFFPLFAISFGWIFTEMGRQPWVVFGQQITADAGSPLLSSAEVWISMIGFTLLVLVALVVFDVPVKGSFAALALGTLFYVAATTGFGQFISTFMKTQVAAVFATALLSIIPAVNFSGLIVPISSLSGSARLIGLSLPPAWYQPVTAGTFTKGLGFADLAGHLLPLSLFIPALTLISLMLVRPQEK